MGDDFVADGSRDEVDDEATGSSKEEDDDEEEGEGEATAAAAAMILRLFEDMRGTVTL